jgi:hypothetical protein
VPDAPGLVSFGAQLDSTVVDPLPEVRWFRDVSMCRPERADTAIATKRSERADPALNVQDRTHLRRTTIDTDQYNAAAAGC